MNLDNLEHYVRYVRLDIYLRDWEDTQKRAELGLGKFFMLKQIDATSRALNVGIGIGGAEVVAAAAISMVSSLCSKGFEVIRSIVLRVSPQTLQPRMLDSCSRNSTSTGSWTFSMILKTTHC